MKGIMTKEEEIKERERMKGTGFEAPCYMHAEKIKRETKRPKIKK
jgi:hypothetical protein